MHILGIRQARLKGAFTIIELLIVITILAILTTLATTNYLAAQTRVRDTGRKTSVNTISDALETYYSINHSFPGDGINYASPTQTQSDGSGCEHSDAISSSSGGPTTGIAPYYYYVQYTTQNGNVSCSTPTTLSKFPQISDWIPGLDPFLSSQPVEQKVTGMYGNVGSSAAYISDYLATKDNVFPIQQTANNTRTFIYHNLNNGYVIYSRLESTSDSSFSNQWQALTSGSCTTTSTALLCLQNNSPASDGISTTTGLPYMPSGLNQINEAAANPIVVYMVRK